MMRPSIRRIAALVSMLLAAGQVRWTTAAEPAGAPAGKAPLTVSQQARQALDAAKIPVPDGCALHSHQRADIDGDGRQDLLLQADCPATPGWDEEYPSDTVFVYRDEGSAHRLLATILGNLRSWEGLQDRDHDGAPELVLQHGQGGHGRLTIYEYGAGELRKLLDYDNFFQSRSVEIRWKDLDDDGVPELLLTHGIPNPRLSGEDGLTALVYEFVQGRPMRERPKDSRALREAAFEDFRRNPPPTRRRR